MAHLANRTRRLDVPRQPPRLRRYHQDARGRNWEWDGSIFRCQETGDRKDWAELIRDEGPLIIVLKARPPRPEIHHLKPNGASTVEDLLRHGETANELAAHLASECMQDNLGDEQTVRDMHDIICALANVQAAFHLLENRLRDGRATTKPVKEVSDGPA